MNLQNGYKKIYEKTSDGTRTFYATKNDVCDPTVDDKIIEATIGEYKLIYEKAGQFFGSKTGIPAETDVCFEGFDKVFKVDSEETEGGEVEDEVVNTPSEPTRGEESTEGTGEGPTYDLPTYEEEDEE